MRESTRKLADSIRETPREIDVQRALIVTRVFKETEGQPQVIRRARALAAVLSEMDLYINDGERIIGNQARKPRAGPLFPEYAHDWILAQLDTFATRPGDRFRVSEWQKAVLRATLPYWEARTVRFRWMVGLPDETRRAVTCGVVANENYSMSGPGHLTPDYETLLRAGVRGIRAEVESCSAAVARDDPARDEKLAFYGAARIVCDAALVYSSRLAALAVQKAGACSDPARRADLLEMADVCLRVPERPAATFREALQSIWTVQVIIQIEANGLSIAPGRFDQLLYPFYCDDLEAGRLTREEALDLLECFYCKLAEINKVYSNEGARLLAGPSQGEALTLAGRTKDAPDGANDLTLLCLEADAEVRLPQPDLALRVNDHTPDSVLMRAAESIRSGLGKPKVFGDELVMQAQELAGVPPEDALEWAALGCSEPVIPGKTDSWGNSGQVCLAKCLELALNDGRCRLTGKQMGPRTGDPRAFASFDEVMTAFKRQVDYFVGHLVISNNLLDRTHAEVAPVPFVSLFISDCVARGVELNAGGARYNFTSPAAVGFVTTSDSLAAVKRLVFDERRVALAELLDALDRDFEGAEPLRQLLLNGAPKFGNDDDYADCLANDVLHAWADSMKGCLNPRGGRWTPSIYSMTASVGFGERCAASPDGRKARQPLNDNISPSHGVERKGPTAIARSVGKLDMVCVTQGAILNMRFSPAVLQGEKGLRDFAAFVRGFVRLGGWHDQFNVIDTATLRDAQAHPERHRGLLVRVSGYSAFFSDLSPEVQEDIIARTEHR